MSILKELKFYAKNLTLLIAEDQKDLNNELVELTSIFFKKVDFAYDGVEALEKYNIYRHDIVLSDITMPNMNGITLSSELKNINPEQPIIVLSAHSELEFLIKLIDIGINQFVAKPFKEEELYYRLLKVCENLIHKKHYMDFVYSKLMSDDSLEKYLEASLNDFENYEDVFFKKEEIKSEKKDSKESVVSQEITESDIFFYDDKNECELNISTLKDDDLDLSLDKKTFLSHDVIDSNSFFENLKSDDLINQVLDDQIETLIELNDDFAECVNRIYLNKLDQKLIYEIANILKNINKILIFMDALRNLANVLDDLSEFLFDLDFDSLDNDKKQKLKILEFIYDDISRFIQTVFVYKDSLDVHYLEDSLKSSCQQLKMNVLNEPILEDELELF